MLNVIKDIDANFLNVLFHNYVCNYIVLPTLLILWYDGNQRGILNSLSQSRASGLILWTSLLSRGMIFVHYNNNILMLSLVSEGTLVCILYLMFIEGTQSGQ